MSRLFALLVAFLVLAPSAFAQSADLAVTKTLVPDAPVPVGAEAVFEISIVNNGPNPATGVVVEDPLDDGLVFISAVATRGSYSPETGYWTIGSLAVGEEETLTLTTQLVVDAPVVNCAAVKYVDQSDPDDTNTSDCVTVEVHDEHTVDIAVVKATDEDTAPIGGNVTFTVTATNNGPDTATGVVVADVLPSGLGYLSSSTTHGTYNPGIGDWDIGTLAAGETAILTIVTTVQIAGSPLENCAILKDVDQEDSNPHNHHSCICINCLPSNGDDGGIESNGNLASLLANRLFQRRAEAADRADAGYTPAPQRLSEEAVAAESEAARASTVLYGLVPEVGPNGSIGYVATPGDLIGITNATAVIAANYLRSDGHRLAAMFGAATPVGEVYDHAKATCDRLAGATLESIQLVSVHGRPFVMKKLVHPDGLIDYSISFVAYRDGASYTIDSRFAPAEYNVPTSGTEVLNLQVWSPSSAYAMTLAQSVIGRMLNLGSVTYLNTLPQPPFVPGTFVRSGYYESGTFRLTIANPAGANAATFSGATSVVEDGAPTPFELTRSLSGEPFETVELSTGFAFDASITMEAGAQSIDQVYFADAPWSYALDDAGALITGFATQPHTTPFPEGYFGLERPAEFSGSVETWASLFRFLNPRAQPRDLSSGAYVEFEAAGTGAYRLTLYKSSIPGWNQYSVDFHANTLETYRFYYSDFTLADGTAGFTAEDVVLVAFYALGPGAGQQPVAFDLAVSAVRFGGLPVDTEPGASPDALSLEAAYPNPFSASSSINFTLPGSGSARVEVFDMLGRRVATLVDEMLPAGRHGVRLEAAQFAAGTYVVRLQAEGQSESIRVTVLR